MQTEVLSCDHSLDSMLESFSWSFSTSLTKVLYSEFAKLLMVSPPILLLFLRASCLKRLTDSSNSFSRRAEGLFSAGRLSNTFGLPSREVRRISRQTRLA